MTCLIVLSDVCLEELMNTTDGRSNRMLPLFKSCINNK
jgi:hypothetical protein